MAIACDVIELRVNENLCVLKIKYLITKWKKKTTYICSLMLQVNNKAILKILSEMFSLYFIVIFVERTNNFSSNLIRITYIYYICTYIYVILIIFQIWDLHIYYICTYIYVILIRFHIYAYITDFNQDSKMWAKPLDNDEWLIPSRWRCWIALQFYIIWKLS